MAGILRRDEQTVRDQALQHLPIATRSVHERPDSAFAQWMHRGDGQQIFGQVASRRKGLSLIAAQGFQSPKAFLNDPEPSSCTKGYRPQASSTSCRRTRPSRNSRGSR